MQETEETQVLTLGREDPLEEATATHPSILAWRTSWTEEHGGPQSIALQRGGHARSDLARMQAPGRYKSWEKVLIWKLDSAPRVYSLR